MNKKLSLSIIILLIIGVTAAIWYFKPTIKDNLKTTTSTKQTNNDTIFDATSTIFGTNIVFAYPKNGFYSHGIVQENYTKDDLLSNSDLFSVKYITTLKPQETNFDPKEYIGVNFGVYEKPTEVKNVEDISNSLNQYGQLESQYSAIKTINKKDFYIYHKFDEGNYQVYTIEKDNIIKINFIASPATETSKENNEKIFYQILEHLQFK